ncbi:hypothetical protein [Streptomyces sp. NBC_01408]|uniref:hypothetical protein n=1 Tax=Streptomyces sp. NBC_01408 TaxID=2903855 RepID=UPI00225A7402|nr:hypothetical protein [Streptomyces sp. NBC_01408]MCX4695080.1 hypothetical protein [Streptomyces sp. NBC_01408]
MDVEEVIDALYGLAPARFTAERDAAAARAKREGDPAAAKRIRGLRRPTLAAWTSNLLVREKPEEVEQFRQLGQALRAAHRSLDGDQLRELSHEQHVVIGALAREAVRLAGEAGAPVSEAVVREVEQILRAVLADPEAAEAWASGRLVKPPAAVTEFPALDPDAAPPAPAPQPPAPARRPSGRRRTDRREAAAARAAAQDAHWAATAREDERRLAEEAHRRAVEEAERASVAAAEAGDRLRAAVHAAGEARRAAAAADQRLRATAADPPEDEPATE